MLMMLAYVRSSNLDMTVVMSVTIRCTPQLSPHLCDETVNLLLSEEDKATGLGEVQRLEAFSLVVQVQGSQMNKSELRHTLYAAFSEEADNILNIQFMS